MNALNTIFVAMIAGIIMGTIGIVGLIIDRIIEWREWNK